MASTPEIFLSYARSDAKEAAEALQSHLGGKDRCFLDTTNTELLDEFPKTIADALLGAKVVLVILSPQYGESWYCQRELAIALGPYGSDRATHLDDAAQAETLEHVVVARLGPHSEAPVLLPPVLATQDHPRAAEPSTVAELIRTVLGKVRDTVRERYARFQVGDDAIRMLMDTSIVPMGPRVGSRPVPTYPPIEGDARRTIGADFIGRARDLWKLHNTLLFGAPRGPVAVTAAVRGFGGYGKTRLALEYFHRFGPVFYPGGNVWIDASGDAEGRAVAEQLREADRELRTHHRSLNIPEDADPRRSLAHTIRHVTQRQRLLFVIDNLPDTGSMGKLEDFCPVASHPAILLTSRREVSWAGVTELSVDVLPIADAVRLLQRKIDAPESYLDASRWRDLAEAVGCLPLVLEVLNGALRNELHSANELADRITAKDPGPVTDSLGDALRDLVSESHLREIAESLLISLEVLDDNAAKELLLRSAWLAPAPLPLALLTDLAGTDDLNELRKSLAELRERSWLQPGQTGSGRGGSSHQLHRVVAAFLRPLQQPIEESRRRVQAVAETVRSHAERLRDADSTTLESLTLLAPHLRALERHFEAREDFSAWKNGLEASLRARIAWNDAVRSRIVGILELFPTPADLARNRQWWPLLESTDLADAVEAWRERGVSIVDIEQGLTAYRVARPRERKVQAPVLMALERLHGDPATRPPRRPLSPEFYATYFDDCGLPPSPSNPTELVRFSLCPPEGEPITFAMGSPEGAGESPERPQREVTVRPFRLGTTPVTWSQYHAFDGAHRPRVPLNCGRPDHPVTEVTWWEAWLFCRWLGGALPSEAQWEAGCRAGTTTRWSFGDEESMLDAHAWHRGNSQHSTHPVGEKLPNPWGLHDLHGNVVEWCADWFAPYPGNEQTDPIGPSGGTARVLRGGCAWNDPSECRSAHRSSCLPGLRLGFFGFRVALPPSPVRSSTLDN